MQTPLIVSATLSAPTQAWLDGLRTRYFPPERNHLAAHLTLFHALPGRLLAEVKRALQQAVQTEAPEAHLTGIMPLGRGFAVRIRAPKLQSIHEGLQVLFDDSLTEQDRRPLHPHVTLQNKVDPAQAKQDRAAVEQHFVPQQAAVVSLRLWHYEGGPWRLAQTFAFAHAEAAFSATR